MTRAKPSVAHPLWDIPTRVFHWLIVCCLPLAWWSAEEHRYDLHQWIGYSVLVLVATRIVWGFTGSRHSRFVDFLVGPGAVLSYLRGGRASSAGHNPLGGWSVVLLLSLLLLQAVSGLFNSDDVLFSGPLYYWADTGFRDAMGVVHDVAFNALLALVCLHIFAVLYHQFRLKENLVQAMLRGSAPGREGRARPVAWWWAALLLGLLALALWWGLEQAPKPSFVF
ncbi:MAG: cytochrome b/b6 domain-containing protein [Halioglobus sp.]|nr:cytochrome b/b6 domain-containing protein [Halioglobus sp.]